MSNSFRPIASLADVEFNEQVPLVERQLAENTYQVIERSAAKFPDKIALQFLYAGTVDEEPVKYTYQQLLQCITQTANGLKALDVGDQDTVSILLPNLPQYHVALWGAEAVAIANPINPLLQPAHIITILNTTKASVLITLSVNNKLWQLVEAIVPHIPTLKHILTVKMPTETSNVVTTIQHRSVRDFDEYIATQSVEFIGGCHKRPSDIAAYFHTGGTTGTPKIAMHSHLNQVFCAWSAAQQVAWNEYDVIHAGLPMFHVNAPLISGLAAFTVGAEVVMTSPQGFRSPTVLANFWLLVEKYKLSFLMAVSTVYVELNKRWNSTYDIRSLSVVACGAAPISTALINEFTERTKVHLIEAYGLTEGGVLSSANPCFGKSKVGSIGIRIPYQEMKAVHIDEKGQITHFCKPNEIGIIAIRGPNVFQGYLRSEDNQGSWLEDGWLNTGDLGREDEEGYFTLTGRKKDLIIRGGHNIDPRLTEEALSQHPAVAMVAAVGKPDSRLGELPVAYVTLREGHTISSDELKQFALQHVSERAAAPHDVYIIEQMPLTAVGKIYKPDLRCDVIKKAFSQALTAIQLAENDYEINVIQDPIHSQVVKITITNHLVQGVVVNQLHECLKKFTVSAEIYQQGVCVASTIS